MINEPYPCNAAMITLKPPVPTRDFEFETTFRPGPDATHDQLTRLSSSRRALAEALIPLILNDSPSPETLQHAIQAAESYQNRWIPFWKTRIATHASLAPQNRLQSVRLPLVFSWRVDVFHAGGGGGGSTEYFDPSPLAETICATLALAICKHRAGALTLGGPDAAAQHFAEAESLLKWTKTAVLPLFRPWSRPGKREPHFYSDVFIEAVEMAVSGHGLCKTALVQSVRGDSSVSTAVSLFRGAKRFQQALALLPGEQLLRHSHVRATSSAYRYLAQALADDTPHMGVAVTCAKEAVRLSELAGPSAAAAATKHREFTAELERRNSAEAGWQPVPQLHQISLVFAAAATDLTVQTQDDGNGIKIIVPLR